MAILTIVDAGPFVAWASADDEFHGSVVATFRDPRYEFVVPALVKTEACYLVGSRIGPMAELQLLNAISSFPIHCPSPQDYGRMAELTARYRDFPLGVADASVIALAERLQTDSVFTTDRRHFSVVRPKHCPAFRLLPEPRPA